MSGIKSPPVLRITVAQLLATILMVGAVWITMGTVDAYSAFLGALISILPNTYFSLRAFRHIGARSTNKVLRGFYVGEAVKLVMMGAGFALAFRFVEPLNVLALFAGFLVIHVIGIIAMVRIGLGYPYQ